MVRYFCNYSKAFSTLAFGAPNCTPTFALFSFSDTLAAQLVILIMIHPASKFGPAECPEPPCFDMEVWR
jgi:hypothetical protein